MHGRSSRGSMPAILAVALLAGACGPAGRTGSAAPAASATSFSSAVPTASAVRPASSVAVEPATTARPSQVSTEPPAASLAVEGGDPVVGQLGSFTWDDGGSDSPWLPGTPMNVGAREPLTVTVGDGVAIAEWTARRVPAGTTNGTGAVGSGAGSGAVAFTAPALGTWSVQVAIRFADDLGSATYYWQLAVH